MKCHIFLGMTMWMVKVAVRAGLVVNYAVILVYKSTVSYPTKLVTFGGPWKFLTHWNLYFQLVYFATALTNEVCKSSSLSKVHSSRIQKFRDYLFSTVSFPFGVFVSVAFWGIYAYKSELMWPQIIRDIFPPWANHMMHTVPILGQVIEMVMTRHEYPERTRGMLTTASVSMSYLVWICYIAKYGGFWVYPVLQVMSPTGRGIFLVTCSACSGLLYLAGEKISSWIWEEKKDEADVKMIKSS